MTAEDIPFENERWIITCRQVDRSNSTADGGIKDKLEDTSFAWFFKYGNLYVVDMRGYVASGVKSALCRRLRKYMK